MWVHVYSDLFVNISQSQWHCAFKYLNVMTRIFANKYTTQTATVNPFSANTYIYPENFFDILQRSFKIIYFGQITKNCFFLNEICILKKNMQCFQLDFQDFCICHNAIYDQVKILILLPNSINIFFLQFFSKYFQWCKIVKREYIRQRQFNAYSNSILSCLCLSNNVEK